MKRLIFIVAAVWQICFVQACSRESAATAVISPAEGAEEVIDVPSSQSKYYLPAEKDLEEKINASTSGLKVIMTDSKYYAVAERVLSVVFTANKDITGSITGTDISTYGKTVKMDWVSEDPVHRPVVGHSPESCEFGLLCLPGDYEGIFSVVTDRYTYSFTREVILKPGEVSEITLDLASPNIQPVRKVGVFGDSISTFDGSLCNEDYRPYYPMNDPNVGVNPDKAVDSKEKTYWWRLIYNYMHHAKLDVNNSWSGTRVVHEIKNGRKSGVAMGAGFIDRAYNFIDPDIIILHGGTNDFNQDTPMGDFDWEKPIGQSDPNFYKSAYVQLIKMLQSRYEGVQIIIVIGDRLAEYEAPTIEIANHFGLPYVDFVGDDIEKCKGSHPTAQGFDFMAQKIYNTCKDYLP